MYVRKQIMKQFSGWRYARFLFHINFSSYHWLQFISIQTDSFRVRSDSLRTYVRIVFALFCLRGNERLYNKESIFISYAISRDADFERYNWLKTIILIKQLEKFPLRTCSFFVRNWLCRTYTFGQYDFVYNHREKTRWGFVRKRIIRTIISLARLVHIEDEQFLSFDSLNLFELFLILDSV